MNEEGLISIDYDTRTKAVAVVYEEDATYNLERIIAYVEDMTEGNSIHITVFEGANMMHNLRKASGIWIESLRT